MILAAEEARKGHLLIAGRWERGEGGAQRATNPATGETIEPDFTLASRAQAERAAAAAARAFPVLRSTAPDVRAELLDRIAANIEAIGEEILARAQLESGLPHPRLQSELIRTTGQLRLFADLLRSGVTSRARIDSPLPDRNPPRPDLRLHWIGVGPVVVFGSSNFPLAFSNAGGDTAAALAAGCPVLVKTHSAHPGTGMLVADAVSRAVADLNLPGGTYSALLGAGNEIGSALVADPRVKAVGFTGSRSGGLALMDIARSRREPIPVYAEMSSVNPVFVFPSAVSDDTLPSGYVASLTLGAGQFCTNPGVIFVPTGPAGDAFVSRVAALIAESAGQTMLTPGIRRAFEDASRDVARRDGVRTIAEGREGDTANAPAARLFEARAELLERDDGLTTEMFGAAGLVLRYEDPARLASLAAGLEGQLTATIHTLDPAEPGLDSLVSVLETKVGRIVFGGWPTGVEVTHAMVHGGPFPATSDGRSTSVGSLAIERFQRPVAYQNAPQRLLPSALADDNP